MKKIKYRKLNYRYSIIALAMINLYPLFGQSNAEKTFEWEHKIDSKTEVILKNYDTELDVLTTNDAVAHFKLNIEVQAKKQEDTDLLMAYFENLEVTIRDNKLVFETMFWKNKLSTGSGSNKKIKIEMKDGNKIELTELKISASLSIPKTTRFKLNSKYSEVSIGDIKSLSLNSYDDEITGKNIENNLSLSAKYSEIVFATTGNASLNLYDTDFNASESENLSITAKYSDVSVLTAENVTINSYDDDITIETMENLTYNAKYSDLVSTTVENVTLKVYDSDIEFETLENITISNSKYSSFVFGNMENLAMTYTYDDKFNIGMAENISINDSKYSNLKIGLLKGNFESKGYDNIIKIAKVTKDCQRLIANQKYGSLQVTIPSDLDFQLKAKTKYGGVNYKLDNVQLFNYVKQSSNESFKLVRGPESDKSAKFDFSGYDFNVSINQE